MFEPNADESRAVTRQVAFVLLAALAITILDIWALVAGRTGGRAPLSALIIAVFSFVAMFHWKEMPLRVAFTLIGMQAAARVILSRTHVSIGWLRIANVAGRMIQLLGVIIIIVVIVKWFGSSRRQKASL
jgi:hypothetical protein